MTPFWKPTPAPNPSTEEKIARLQAEIQKLKSDRSQIEGILQSMAEGVLVVGPDGRLLLVNQSAREILGMGPEAQAGLALAEAARQPGLREVVRRVLATRQAEVLEMELYTPRERILQLRAAICPVLGVGECALLVFHDVTELKRLERIRREFVANVSHELKSPITTIQGAAETLLDGALEEPQNARAFLVAIQEETERLRRLVEDLLSLARLESQGVELKREPISLASFLQETAARYQGPAASRQVRLHLEIGSLPPVLHADRDQLAHAVGNLLDNAVKYNRPGGEVWLRGRTADGFLTLEVEDTGIGIPPEDLSRIFERFYRVEKGRSRETGSTGLGLSIVKHIAERHGGSVRAESEFGRGSRFILTLLF